MSPTNLVVWLLALISAIVGLVIWWEPWRRPRPSTDDRHADALERIARAMERLAEKL